MTGCAGLAPPATFPPEVAGQFSGDYAEVDGEPPFWPAGAAKGYKSRIRLSVAGIACLQVLIRIDERSSGRAEGHLVLIDRKCGRPRQEIVTESDFTVTRDQRAQLEQLIERARLWRIYPEFYNYDSQNICLDGEELVFERVDARGYRFSTANAQCTAPRAVLDVAARMIELAGAKRARSLLN